MAALNAITNDALLSIVEWGEDTLRAPGAGETAWVLANVDDVDQIVIDANGPAHTKVVADVATEMTTPQKDAVDAAALVIIQAANMAALVATLDGNPVKMYAGVSSAVVLSWAELDLNIDLTGDLGSGDITFSDLPIAGVARQITVEVVQGGTGGHAIHADAWTAVDWGDAGAPEFGNDADTSKIVVLYCNGVKILGFANSSVFGP